MGGSYKVKLKGDKKLARALAKRGKLLAVIAAVKDAGKTMEKEAKDKVPEGETKNLKKSITTFRSDFHYGITATEPYAQYVEFGTKAHGKAQPFMQPAQTKGRDKLKKNLKKLVR